MSTSTVTWENQSIYECDHYVSVKITNKINTEGTGNLVRLHAVSVCLRTDKMSPFKRAFVKLNCYPPCMQKLLKMEGQAAGEQGKDTGSETK